MTNENIWHHANTTIQGNVSKFTTKAKPLPVGGPEAVEKLFEKYEVPCCILTSR
ncbi:MAG TPA: hypothetical protein PKD91_04910 [Bacteroidia bacterium]|nr:hypothetical protein [Bacteroidia bacterium]